MKKQILLFSVLTLLTISIVSSCKKDPNPSNNEQPTDTIPVVTTDLRFGDTTGMIVTHYDSIMEFDDWHPFVLDLNGGGNDDIKIETVYDGPLAIGEFQKLTLYCLNGHTELLADSIVKESYSHRETTYDTIDDFVVITHAFIFSTCDKIDENDPVNTSKVFEALAKDDGDSFGIDDPYLSGNVVLFRQDVEYSWADPTEETVDVSYNKSTYHCWNFPTDEEKYIGFRITQHGNSRYGWLKIKLHSTWNGKVVNTELIETAIQK
ncbi:MAG: hypothetical protein J6P83_09085 [Bacteroidales bacterium]|nr:hypothetical protein [Bacteroidales bacterium]